MDIRKRSYHSLSEEIVTAGHEAGMSRRFDGRGNVMLPLPSNYMIPPLG
jgi:hypothetical protein